MTVSRNYDIEQINKTYTSSQHNWLKPAETSIKAEKLKFQMLTRIKHLVIGWFTE